MTDANDTPPGYRVHTNTWTAYGPQLPMAEVFSVLDRIDDERIEAAVQSLQPENTRQEQ